MANIYPFKEASLEQMMNEFHRQFDIAETSDKKSNNARLKAGQLLKDMRKQVEANGEKWWPWFEAHSVRSRKDAEELLEIVGSDDPEAAYEEGKERQRYRMSRARAREKEFPVEALKKKIGKLTDEQRHELSAWFRSEYGL